MARNSERAQGIAYPQLRRDQINSMIDNLLFARRNRNLGRDEALVEATIGYLVEFYTKRWGLPPAITNATSATAGASRRPGEHGPFEHGGR